MVNGDLPPASEIYRLGLYTTDNHEHLGFSLEEIQTNSRESEHMLTILFLLCHHVHSLNCAILLLLCQKLPVHINLVSSSLMS